MAIFDDDTMDLLNSEQNFINQNNPLNNSQQSQYRTDGFLLPATFSADGNGLPYTKVQSGKPGIIKRNIITWFIPEFGLVRMYINPQNISYVDRKLIHKDRTKGGFTLQYWGEDLTTINLSGTTGSSGIEGINMLYEMYRAEQYAFDGVGLTLAASNSSTDLASKAVSAIGGAIGGGLNALVGGSFDNPAAQALGGGILGGLLGVDSPNNNSLAPKNIMSLAQLAFGVELYYSGVVYRGYFDNMTVNERADNFLLDYQITFISTQKRGYRQNYLPFHKDATSGPSQYETNNSFDLNKIG